jgi:hypothetical protein
MLTPPGGDETGRRSLARAGRTRTIVFRTRVASRPASRAEFRRSRGTESSNPSPSSGESGANLTGLRPESAGRGGIFMTAGSEIAIALPNLPRSV